MPDPRTTRCHPLARRAAARGSALALAASLLVRPGAAPAAEYRLGPQDRLRLVVVEWRPSRAEAYAWTALNGEFTITAAGALVLPLVGAVKAEALTVEELGEAVADRLRTRMGLVDRPSASIEVTQFRPFYVTGDVANPGEFPYRPGLSVLKALSVAGGPYRPLGVTAAALERDATLARGDLRTLAAEQAGLRARRARLEAEVADKAEVEFPPALSGPRAGPDAADAVREERLIFEARRSTVRSKIVSLNQAKTLLEKEVAALVEKDANLGRQLGLAIAERENVKSLAGRGLVITSRQITTEQNVAQMESARLDVGIARVRAEQDRGRIDRDIIDLQTQRRAETLLELRQTEGRLAELRERLSTSERLAFGAEVSMPRRAAEEERERASAPKVLIVRGAPGGPAEIEATLATQVEPGDVVQVRRVLAPTPLAQGPPAHEPLAQGPLAQGPVAWRDPDRPTASPASATR